MNKLGILIILLLSLSSYAQIEQINHCDTIKVDGRTLYQTLNKKPIIIKYKYDRKFLKNKYILKNKFNIALIDSEMKITSYEHKGYVDKPLKSQRDFLLINNKKILIDSLYFGNNLPSDYTFMTYFYSSYTFEFSNKKYKALFADNVRENTSLPNTLLILLDVSKKDSFNIILIDFQACSDISCFGDINNDGKLDYLHWSMGNNYIDSVYIYSLDESKNIFIKDELYYIKLKESIEWGYYLIDIDKSKYFYNLCPI